MASGRVDANMPLNRILPFIVFVASCSLITDFDRNESLETSALLCADSIDNDADGLSDCQDWKCLKQAPCCDVPEVVIDEDFSRIACATAACTKAPNLCVPDSQNWQSWGLPMPTLCGGGLNAGKSEQCFDVGVLSKRSFPLQSGLHVVVTMAERPETKGGQEAALTFQDEIFGSPLDSCLPLDPVTRIAGIALESGETSTSPAQLVARFGRRVVGHTAVAPSVGVELKMQVRTDRRIDFLSAGVVFATSATIEVVPENAAPVHLVLFGRGNTTKVVTAKVSVGTRCEQPETITPTKPAIVLSNSDRADAWDSFSVFRPALITRPQGQTLMYGGCRGGDGECTKAEWGIGAAESTEEGVFVRPAKPCQIFSYVGGTCPGGGLAGGATFPFAGIADFGVTQSETFGFLGVASAIERGQVIVPLVSTDGATWGAADALGQIVSGATGAWDAGEICCASVKEAQGRVRVWYSGRSREGGPWQIGLAQSVGRGPLIKIGNDPVVPMGSPGTFDASGASDPEVLWDEHRKLYRMWYVAHGFLDQRSLAYAVSTDGIVWHKYPGNPVLDADRAGLRRVSTAAVKMSGGSFHYFVEGQPRDATGTRIYGFVNQGVPAAGKP
jgi:hypothetical protein